MTASVRQRILLAGSDVDFRQEVFNFLLSEGCDVVTSTGRGEDVIGKLRTGRYDVVVLDADSIGEEVEALARAAASLVPGLRVIIAIAAEAQGAWGEPRRTPLEIQILIKDRLAQDLPFLLQA